MDGIDLMYFEQTKEGVAAKADQALHDPRERLPVNTFYRSERTQAMAVDSMCGREKILEALEAYVASHNIDCRLAMGNDCIDIEVIGRRERQEQQP